MKRAKTELLHNTFFFEKVLTVSDKEKNFVQERDKLISATSEIRIP